MLSKEGEDDSSMVASKKAHEKVWKEKCGHGKDFPVTPSSFSCVLEKKVKWEKTGRRKTEGSAEKVKTTPLW